VPLGLAGRTNDLGHSLKDDRVLHCDGKAVGKHRHDGKHSMRWRVRYDRDAFKELWLCFENEHGHFPLYPGQSAWIEYSYRVSDEKWGTWYQRAVRLPTKHLAVRLVFPSHLEPMVWGMETSMTAEALPFRTAIEHGQEDGNDVFTWSTDDPRCTPATALSGGSARSQSPAPSRPRLARRWQRSASSRRATRSCGKSPAPSTYPPRQRTLAASSRSWRR
jgi:hypothetical protein